MSIQTAGVASNAKINATCAITIQQKLNVLNHSNLTKLILYIRPNLTCNAVGTIYLINDKICSKSYVGSSITTCKTRFSNHKSHIKSYYLDCELAQHFKEFDETHKLDRTNTISFKECLKTQLEIIIIDQLVLKVMIAKLRKCGNVK